jgi:AraC-like DNA-binding protein
MKRIKPLSRFSIINTNRVEEAEFKLSQTLTNLQIKRINDRRSFQLEMNAFNLGSSSLVYNQFGVNTKIEIGPDIDYTLFVIGRGVPCTIYVDREPVVVSPQKAAILTRGRKVQIERPKNSEAIVLRASMSDIWHHFVELTARHHRGSLIFDRSVDLIKGPGAMLKRHINCLIDELEHNDQVVKNPVLRKSYDHKLLTALLSLPHNKRETLLEDRRRQVAPGIVRRAEEYIRAHSKEAISIIDLLRICGCSRRVLFSAFRNARGYTPMEFLTEQRLQRVREILLKPHPQASVADIAVDCGFRHLGRFSQFYWKRFGERPSDTLRKGK